MIKGTYFIDVNLREGGGLQKLTKVINCSLSLLEKVDKGGGGLKKGWILVDVNKEQSLKEV